ALLFVSSAVLEQLATASGRAAAMRKGELRKNKEWTDILTSMPLVGASDYLRRMWNRASSKARLWIYSSRYGPNFPDIDQWQPERGRVVAPRLHHSERAVRNTAP